MTNEAAMQPGQSSMSLTSGQAVNDLLNWLLFYDLGSISQQHDSDRNYANILNQLTEEFQIECVSVLNFIMAEVVVVLFFQLLNK